MAFISVVCAILNIVLNYFGIIYFGYIACAYTTLITYIIFAIGHYIFMKIVLHKNHINHNIYNIKLLIFISLGIISYSIIVLVLYNYPLLRYCVISIFVILCIVKRKKIFEILKLMLNK